MSLRQLGRFVRVEYRISYAVGRWRLPRVSTDMYGIHHGYGLIRHGNNLTRKHSGEHRDSETLPPRARNRLLFPVTHYV